jgi:acetylornithine/N-succinyldiaminopimelate aminotransferase
VALKVLEILTHEGVLENAVAQGAYLRRRLEGLQIKHPVIREVRGLGLLVGARLGIEGAPIVKACRENGYLINCVQDNVLRFAPPLIVTQDEIDGLIACLDRVLEPLHPV